MAPIVQDVLGWNGAVCAVPAGCCVMSLLLVSHGADVAVGSTVLHVFYVKLTGTTWFMHKCGKGPSMTRGDELLLQAPPADLRAVENCWEF